MVNASIYKIEKFIYNIYLYMSKNNSNMKNNLIKLTMFLSLVLLSAFLLMAGINMLNLQNTGVAGGDTGNTSSSQGNNKQPEPSMNFGNGRKDDWQERVDKRRSERKSSESFSGEFSYGESQGEGGFGSGEFVVPKNVPNIDISGENIMPDIPFGSGEGGQTIALGNERQPHMPVFEVLGYPNYPFLKVMVMENYYKNHWLAVEEEPEVKINFDEKLEEKFTTNSVKIKPIQPSSGYLPVLSGVIDFKYRSSVNWYKIAETYYAEDTISDFYSMDYMKVASNDKLMFADTDDSYPYTISVPAEIDSIIDTIIEKSSSDFDIIMGVENYLRTNYSLQNGNINIYGNNDGIMSFLMKKGGAGNTLDFMSAYAYLLRASGIPCRLAVGYKINRELPYQVVYRDQAYIYPEIKFKEYGWVPMDVFGYNPSFTPEFETVTKLTSVSDEARRGTSFTAKGTVTDANGQGLDDMTVLIYVKPSKTDNTLSYVKADVNNGQFEVTCDIKHSTDAGKYQVVADLLENDLYRTSTSDPEMRVTTDTHIELNVINSVIGKSFEVQGQLLDSYSKEGVPNQSIELRYLSLDVIDSVLTGEEGKFSKIVELENLNNISPHKNFFFVKGYDINYKIEFLGTDIFYPSNTDSNIYIWRILWLRIMLFLLLIAIVIVVLIVTRVIKRRSLQNEEDLVFALDGDLPNPVTDYVQTVTRDVNIRMFIGFPQIKDGYPDVWGINEELVIRFEDDSQNLDEIKTTFDHKGTYRIKVLEGAGKIAKRDIRIVNYREEVIEKGKLLLKGFSKNIDINDKMTLREILLLMKSQLSTMQYMILEQIFIIMEKAVYSLSDITRDDYELFYMCIQKYEAEK